MMFRLEDGPTVVRVGCWGLLWRKSLGGFISLRKSKWKKREGKGYLWNPRSDSYWPCIKWESSFHFPDVEAL